MFALESLLSPGLAAAEVPLLRDYQSAIPCAAWVTSLRGHRVNTPDGRCSS